MLRVTHAIAALALAVTVRAEAAKAQAAAPAGETRPIAIVYPDRGPSGLSDVPMGTHRIPDTNVYITGHQQGALFGALFGFAGIVAVSEANASAGARKVASVEDDLRFDVAAKAAEMTRAIVAEESFQHRFTMSGAGGGTLTVVPFVAITLVGDNAARPYVALKTTLSSGPAGAPRTIRYFCCEGKALSLTGTDSLSADNGKRLKELLTSELDVALRVMLRDRSQRYVRDDRKKVVLKGYLPMQGRPLKYKGYDLGRYNDYTLLEFSAGGGTGGVHIVEPGSLEITLK